MPEMVVPKSSHDRFCLKKSSPNARSTITISESVNMDGQTWTRLLIPDYWYLVQGTFLPPNGSISNITGWKLVYPTSGEIPRLFWIQKIRKSPKWGLKFQGRVILGKKRPLPGSLQTVVRSGEAPPDGQSIKIQSRFWSKNDFFQKSITPKMPKSKASLNSPFWGLLDFGEGLLRSLTAPKSLTALPIP